jgi:hypothetical protein
LGGILSVIYAALASGPVPNHRARGLRAEGRPIVAPAADVTAEDVALELVATKMALQQLVWLISDTTNEPGGFVEWVHRSPVPLPKVETAAVDGWYTEPFASRLMARADEIEIEMMEAVGHWLLGTIRDRRDAGGHRDA